MATKFLDLDGLKYFKTKQDAANDGKYVPQGITISVEPSAGSSTWIEAPTEDLYIGGTEPTDQHTIWIEVSK